MPAALPIWATRRTERQAEVRALRAEGRTAQKAGRTILDNPHKYCDADQWERGFMEALGLKRFDELARQQARARAVAAARNTRRGP